MVTQDSGETWIDTWKYAIPVNPKRVDVLYGPDGGAKADGVIYVRPGVADLTLGPKNYAQVRIQVGDGHYLKGMAVYKDDMPDGVDLLFNTNKERPESGNKLDVMKKLESDPELPFGSVVRNIPDRDGPDWKPASVMNLVNDEGDWAKWSKTISSQMLSKQNPKLIKEQLDITFDRKKAEYEEIKALTNPTLKKKLLEEFAETADKASVDLRSAQLERSSWHVILPVNSLKPNEIYAPGYNNGETVALIRYPHAGPFEIPLLTVNNKNRDALKIIGPQSKDAVAIHHTVAERLSGADFDGDTVLVVPNDHRTNKVKTQPALKDLEGFDPKVEYKGVEGQTRLMTKGATQQEMGKISNLITDMQLQGASDRELANAVKHSMVVIDAEKHKLDYRRSYQDNGISALKEKYQSGGASTLISRARANKRIDERKPRSHGKGGPIDPKTGELVWEPTGRSYVNKKGVDVKRGMNVPRLSDTNDAFTLTSKGKASPRAEVLYAEQSNRLKALANQARLDALATPNATMNPSAKKVYAAEVQTLNAKIAQYDRNKPRDRAAQDIANASLRERIRHNPEIKDDKKKVRKIAAGELRKARARTGVERIDFTFTDREWEAIQAGAISNDMMKKILKRADPEHVKQRATPKTQKTLMAGQSARAKAMLAQGHTRSEVAAALGVSLSTLDRATSEGGV
jgi:transposase